MKKLYYITGASGFVGSHLIKALHERTIICIPHSEIMKTKLEPFDSLYFLSTYGNMYFHTDDRQILQANIGDLIHLLLEAKSCGFKSFVYISTSSVELPVQTMYSRTKKAAEEILLAFIEKYQLPICIIRPATIIGPQEQKEHLIPALIRSCLRGERIPFVKNATHDFVDVRDVVDVIINLSENNAMGIFGVGLGVSISNQEVKELIERITEKKANIYEVEQLRSYDNTEWKIDNSKVKKLGWKPKHSLDSTIRLMVSLNNDNKV